MMLIAPADLFPVILALLSAVLFALGDQFQNQGLASTDSRAGAVISVGTSAVLFILAAPFLIDLGDLLHPAVLIFVLVGLFRPGVSVNLALAGMRHLGPTLTTTLTSTSPLFGAAFAILWLGEMLTWPTGVGTVAIVLAVMMLAKRGGGVAAAWPLWALAFPIGAAIIRSLGHVLSKVGMESVPDPYIASMVTFVISALVTVSIHKARRDAPAIAWSSRGAAWFAGAGVLFCLAVLALNFALLQGRLLHVVPIVSASPVFTMLLSIYVFRRERITPRIGTVVLVVVSAVTLIAIGG